MIKPASDSASADSARSKAIHLETKEKAVNRNRQMTFNKFTSLDEQGIFLSFISQNLQSDDDDDDVGRMQMVSRKVSAKKSRIDFRQFSSSARVLESFSDFVHSQYNLKLRLRLTQSQSPSRNEMTLT